MRRVQARRPPRERLLWNRVRLTSGRRSTSQPDGGRGALIDRYARETEGLGIEMVIIAGRMREPRDGELRERVLRLFAPAGRGVMVEIDDPPTRPLQPLDEGARRIVQARRRGIGAPVRARQGARPERSDAPARIPRGEFVEHDLDDDGRSCPSTGRRPERRRHRRRR